MIINKNFYIEKTQEEINEEFMQACHTGNLNLVKFLLTDNNIPFKAQFYYLNKQCDYINSLLIVCKNNHLNIIEYFFTSDELKDRKKADGEVLAGLSVAAAYGNLDIVKFLLKNENIEYIDINSNISAFISACGSGELEIVKFLTSSPEIKVHINPTKYYLGFKKACANNHINIAKYFLEDTNLLQELNGSNYREIFLATCHNNSVDCLDYILKTTYLEEYVNIQSEFINLIDKEMFEVIRYLIFEYDINTTSEIDKYIKNHDEVKNWFKTRDLNKELNKELISSKDNNKKLKIKL